MDTNRLREELGKPLRWLAEGWRNISSRAANALTYFNPSREDEGNKVDDLRWGLLALDVSEHDDKFVISLEAPGLDKDEIEVTIDDHRVIVTGTKRYERERKEGQMHITERAFGTFERVIPLPERVSSEGAEATYKRGVLTLHVPKASVASSKRIPVQFS